MKDHGYSQFKDCEATAQFIEVIQLVIIQPSTCFIFIFWQSSVKFAVVQSIPVYSLCSCSTFINASVLALFLVSVCWIIM